MTQPRVVFIVYYSEANDHVKVQFSGLNIP